MSFANFKMNSTSAVVGIAGVATVTGAFLYQKYRSSFPDDNKWKEVGNVSQLMVYPLKSGRRTEINSASVDWFGCHVTSKDGYALRDRSFVIYDEKTHAHQTSRTRTDILKVTTSYDAAKGTVIISAPDVSDLELDVTKISKENPKTKIMGHGPKAHFAIDCGDEAAVWISIFLTGQPYGLRLAYSDTSVRRKPEESKHSYINAFPKMWSASPGIYADFSSILLVNEASLEDLNKKIQIPENKVSEHNFRPNIIIRGPGLKPWSEDSFKWIKIGDTVYQSTAPCGRCVFTTINPENGEKNKDVEPLKTLRTFRKVSELFGVTLHDPAMGIFLEVKKNGTIDVGDKVYVQ